MSNLGFLGLAYVVVFVAIAGYVLYLANKQKQLETKLDSLSRDHGFQDVPRGSGGST